MTESDNHPIRQQIMSHADHATIRLPSRLPAGTVRRPAGLAIDRTGNNPKYHCWLINALLTALWCL
jgi:hypothetical protein